MQTFLTEHLRTLDAKMRTWESSQSEVWGIPTGIRSLDRLTGGLQPGEVTVIAGRPGMGKTAAAGQIGFDIARHFQAQDLPSPPAVVIFEAETYAWQLLLRELARKSGVPANRIKSGFLTEADRAAIQAAREEMASLPVIINDTHAISSVQVRNELRRLRETWRVNIGLVVYDHVNLAGDEATSDYRRVSQAAENLRVIAKQLGVPVVMLAQVHRQDERGEDTIPRLSDLKDSGKIEEAADVVLFIHRPEYYKKLAERSHASEESALLVVAKNRNGEDGIGKVKFYPQFTEFRDPEEERSVYCA